MCVWKPVECACSQGGTSSSRAVLRAERPTSELCVCVDQRCACMRGIEVCMR